MGRLLGPTGYGELATLISLVGLILIIPTSFGLAITHLVATKSDDPKTKPILSWLLKRSISVGICISIIFCLAAPYIAGYLKISSIWSVVLIGAFFITSMISFVYKSTLQGLLKFGSLILATMGETFTKLILGALFVYFGYGVFGAVGGILLGAFLGLFIAYRYVSNFLKIEKTTKIKNENLKDLFLFSVPVTIYTVAQTSLFSADLILVKHFFPSFEAGLYAALSSLGKIILFGAGPIVYVMFPMISQRYAKKQNYKKIFLLSLAFTVLVCSAVSSLYYLFPQIAILGSVGGSYLEASHMLFLFGIFVSLVSISNLLVNYMLSLKQTSVVILPTIAAIAQILLINYFHSSLTEVINVSIIICSLLLVSLSIYIMTRNVR